MKPHYHVVAFIPGCLNDYDSGPIDTLAEAREELLQYVDTGGMQPERPCKTAGPDRYTNGPYVITIEECAEECDPESDY